MKTREFVRKKRESLRNTHVLFVAIFFVAIFGFGYLRIFGISKVTMDYREQPKALQKTDMDRKSANSNE